MVKYGVVGALALAVLVAAMWDSSSTKKPTDGANVDGAVGAAKPAPTQQANLTAPTQQPIAQKPEPAKPIVEEMAKYEVKAKDTLRTVAKKWLHDEARWKELLEFNKDRVVDPEKLHKGLTLVFPKSRLEKPQDDGSATAVPGGFKKDEMQSEEMPAGSERKYVVKDGDTLFAIARHELGSGSRWKDIAKINKITGDTVRKGQTLLLPPK